MIYKATGCSSQSIIKVQKLVDIHDSNSERGTSKQTLEDAGSIAGLQATLVAQAGWQAHCAPRLNLCPLGSELIIGAGMAVLKTTANECV